MSHSIFPSFPLHQCPILFAFLLPQVVNVVVPVRGATTRLRDLLDHLAEGVLPFDPALSLTLIAKDIRTAGEVTAMAEDAFKALTSFKWKVNARDALTANGLTIDDALTKEFGDTVLVAEEEPFLHPDFLVRCRGNVARGRQVYICLSHYLSVYVYVRECAYAGTICDVMI